MSVTKSLHIFWVFRDNHQSDRAEETTLKFITTTGKMANATCPIPTTKTLPPSL